jgi:hypothetical protein
MKFSIQQDSGYNSVGRDYIEIDNSDMAELCQLENSCNKCYGVGKLSTKVKRKKVESVCDICKGRGKHYTPLGQQLYDFLKEQIPKIWQEQMKAFNYGNTASTKQN